MKLFTYANGYLLLLCMAFLFTSCGDDAEEGQNQGTIPDQGFTINSDEYNTPNAYLVFESVLQYDSETMMDVSKTRNLFSFLFLNGSALSDNGKILYSTSTTQSSYHHFRDFGGENVVDDIESILITTGSFVQSPSTTTRINITDIPAELMDNNVSYGDPIFAGISFPLANEDVASFKINSIDIDYGAMKGTIDCEYSISPSFEGAITGRYIGEFSILVE
ncbi:MAG: hypothetical protein P1U56_20905 [Saprospiraceae bacterium]|nr:hypothetical protein [Saprospiraceae bacterium]